MGWRDLARFTFNAIVTGATFKVMFWLLDKPIPASAATSVLVVAGTFTICRAIERATELPRTTGENT